MRCLAFIAKQSIVVSEQHVLNKLPERVPLPFVPQRGLEHVGGLAAQVVRGRELLDLQICLAFLRQLEVVERAHTHDQVGYEEHSNEASHYPEEPAEVGSRVDVSITNGRHRDHHQPHRVV